MGGEGQGWTHTCRLIVGPAPGHAEGRALILQLGLRGQVPSVGSPCLHTQFLSCPQFPWGGAPMDGRDFWLKGALMVCIMLSPVSLCLRTRRGNGKFWPPHPLSCSPAHRSHRSAPTLRVPRAGFCREWGWGETRWIELKMEVYFL